MNDAGREQTQEDAGAGFPRRRHPLRPTVITGIVALLVLVIAGGFAVVHTLQGGIFSPAPTPTLAPGSDLFYIELSPLWGSISIDGQTLAHLPDPATNPPLKLSIGVHQVVWRSDPFLSQRCTIIVPPNPTGTNCLSNDTLPARGEKGVNAWVITFSLSMTNLSDTQRAALLHAAQADLDSLQSSEIVQPGEQFVNLQAPNFIDTVTQPLRATLRFQLDTDPNSNAPCIGGFGQATNCTGLGQNCHLLCSQLPPSSLGPPQRWDVYAPVRSLWDYRTLGGQPVAQNQPGEPDTTGTEYLVSLSITWDGAHWHVTTNPPPSQYAFLSIDPACVVLNGRISQDITFNNVAGTTGEVSWQYTSGPNRAAGCLAEAYLQPDNPATPITTTSKPVAYCLYRFGVLLAVDDEAHRSWPNLPVVDAYEKSLAQRLATMPASP